MYLGEIDVSDKKIAQFNKKGINTVEDLLYFYPRKYKDYRKVQFLSDTTDGDRCSILATIKNVDFFRSEKTLPNGTVMDTSRVEVIALEDQTLRRVKIVYFHQSYKYKTLSALKGCRVAICGTVTVNDFGYQITNPDKLEEDPDEVFKIHPVYSDIPGMSQDYISKTVSRALAAYEAEDPAEADVMEKFGVISEYEMFVKIHNPKNEADIRDAKQRIIYDTLDAFVMQTLSDEKRLVKKTTIKASRLANCNKVIASLPYELTDDQKHVIHDLIYKTKDGKRLNALLQGDVGCGKTICAFLLMLAMSDNGYQSVLMAPTAVLARQHFKEFQALISPLGLSAVYLGGELKAADKKKALKQIETQQTDFVIGTHAVISDKVKFKNLGIAIVDEEHKFGTLQKENLRKKMEEGVHSVTMSATPIPRSLALALYDDAMDIYTITTMPKGRKKILTTVSDSIVSIYHFLQGEIEKGHQCYIVCPQIDEDEENLDIYSVDTAIIEAASYLKQGTEIAGITGRMKDSEKTEVIEAFNRGDISVLVATTIIEVGINVPNATAILILNADRFGLAGLHQLRGRVGRGTYQSYCILESKDLENRRLQAMCESTDGFYLAEKDLTIRGAGDFIGTKQSGNNEAVNLVIKYPKLYKDIKNYEKNKVLEV